RPSMIRAWPDDQRPSGQNPVRTVTSRPSNSVSPSPAIRMCKKRPFGSPPRIRIGWRPGGGPSVEASTAEPASPPAPAPPSSAPVPAPPALPPDPPPLLPPPPLPPPSGDPLRGSEQPTLTIPTRTISNGTRGQ